MAIVGFLLQLATVVLMGYLGYTFQMGTLEEMQPLLIIYAVSPLGFIIGHLMRKSARQSTPRPGSFFTKINDFVSAYLVCLVISAVCFGIGFAIFHLSAKLPWRQIQ